MISVIILLLFLGILVIGSLYFDLTQYQHKRVYENKERRMIERFEEKIRIENEIEKEIEEIIAKEETKKLLDSNILTKIMPTYPDPDNFTMKF